MSGIDWNSAPKVEDSISDQGPTSHCNLEYVLGSYLIKHVVPFDDHLVDEELFAW